MRYGLCFAMVLCWVGMAGFAEEGEAKAPPESEKSVEAEPAREGLGLERWVQIHEGRWRVEGSGGLGLHQGDQDHSGDILFLTGVEYEIPVLGRGTVGLKVTPTFIMTQKGGETLWGAGVGLAIRTYQVKHERRGFFIEGECQIMGHYPKFEGNSGSFNFLTGGGIGYKFKNDWHVTAKFAHLSNAGLARDNAGFNSVNLGAGFTF